jgi:hypothetical protein
MIELLQSVKIVVNRCYGGFGLSKAAVQRLYELGVRPSEKAPAVHTHPEASCFDYWMTVDLSRTDPRLIQVVEELGEAASGGCAQLRVVEAQVYLDIEDYDGKETAYVRGGEAY